MIKPSHFLLSHTPEETPIFRRRGSLVTFGEFRHDVACLVSSLRQSGAARVVLCAADNYVFAVELMACLHAGQSIIIPGNTCRNTRERLASPQTVFTDALAPSDSPAELVPVDAENVVVEFYTSGSTGEPKRIVRSFANLEAELQMLEAVFPENGQMAEVFPTVSYHHAYGIIFGLMLPMSRGMLTDTAPFPGLEPWLARVERCIAPTSLAWLVTTPAFLRVWADSAELNRLTHSSVRLLSAGAPLPVRVARTVSGACAAEVYEIFGSSETGVVACRRPLETDEWQCFAEVRMELSENAGMRVYSPAVAGAGGITLGDSAEMLGNGRFRLLPRVDRLVKLADKRLSLAEVEQCLQESGLVNEAYALVLNQPRVSRLAVAVVPSPMGMQILQEQGYGAYKKELRNVLSRRIESVLLPRKWRVVGELPGNSQGKVTRIAVESLFRGALQLPVMTPVSKSENQLVFNLLYVRDAGYFAGHFPGYPIVPGVVILQSIATLLRNYWGLSIEGISRLKFSAETLPGHTQVLTLNRKSDAVSLEIALQHSGSKACQGRFQVAAEAGEPLFSV